MVKYVELSPSLWGYIRRCLKTLQDPDTYLGLVIGHPWNPTGRRSLNIQIINSIIWLILKYSQLITQSENLLANGLVVVEIESEIAIRLRRKEKIISGVITTSNTVQKKRQNFIRIPEMFRVKRYSWWPMSLLYIPTFKTIFGSKLKKFWSFYDCPWNNLFF